MYEKLTREMVKELYYDLNIFIGLYEGNFFYPAGRMFIRKNYLRPTIKLYQLGLDRVSDYSEFKKWSEQQLKLHVLFHELYHIVNVFNNLDKYLEYINSPEEISGNDPKVEEMADKHSEEYLRELGLLKGLEKLKYKYCLEYI